MGPTRPALASPLVRSETGHMKNREAGFTTLELVTTLVIISILTIMTMPALWGAVQAALGANQVRGAAEQVAASIEQTRAYAVMQSCTYRATFPGNNQVRIGPAPGGNCLGGAPGEGPTQLIHNASLSPQGGPDGGCGGTWCIWYDSTGTSSGGSLVVAQGSNQRTVTVTVAGRVQVLPP